MTNVRVYCRLPVLAATAWLSCVFHSCTSASAAASFIAGEDARAAELVGGIRGVRAGSSTGLRMTTLKVLQCGLGSVSLVDEDFIVKHVPSLAATRAMNLSRGCRAKAAGCEPRGRCEMFFNRKLEFLGRQQEKPWFARALNTILDKSGVLIATERLNGIQGYDAERQFGALSCRRAALSTLAKLHAQFWGVSEAELESGCAHNGGNVFFRAQAKGFLRSQSPWIRRFGRAAHAIHLRLETDPMGATMLHGDV